MLLNKELKPMIESNLHNMTNSEKEVAYYFLNQKSIEDCSTEVICKKIYVSKATLTRFSKKCGFTGFREFIFQYKKMLEEKEDLPVYRDLTKQVLFDYEEVLRKYYAVVDEIQLERITRMIEQSEQVYLYGQGSSELALKEMKTRFMRLGIKGEVMSGSDMFKWNNLLLDDKCLVIGATVSGTTEIVLEAMEDATRKGAKTVLMTTRNFDKESFFCDELLLLPSTQYLSYGNRISPQIPILLIIDCLFAYYLDVPSRRDYYEKTIIHKEKI